MLICKICEKSMNVITWSHLKKYHDMAVADYKIRFPGEMLVYRSPETCENISKSLLGNKRAEGHIVTDVMRGRMSEARKGIIPKYKNPELRGLKISKSLTGRKLSEEHKMNSKAGIKAWWNVPENKARMCKIRQKTWADEDFKVAQIEKMNSASRIGPTRPELLVKDIIDSLGLYFKYVGDGSFWIRGKNPDFINVPDKKIIEVFGCYYHGCISCAIPNSLENDLAGRMEHYKKYGYKMLVLWEHEMPNVDLIIAKIIEYTNINLPMKSNRTS